MSESSGKHLFTCTGFDFFVDRCEGCDKKSGCEKYVQLLKEEKEIEKGLNSYYPDPAEFYDFGDERESDCGSGDDCRHCDLAENCSQSSLNPDNCSKSYSDCDLSCKNPTECGFYNDMMEYEFFPITDDDLPF